MVCILLVNSIQLVQHCKHNVSKLYQLHFTVDSGYVLTVTAVLSCAPLLQYNKYARDILHIRGKECSHMMLNIGHMISLNLT